MNHSSTIIEKLLEDYGHKPGTAIAYFYFDFGENKKQCIRNCLSSSIAQICRHRSCIPDEIESFYTRQKSTTVQPLVTDLLDVLSTATDGLEVFLICDALDECTDQELLMDALSAISSGTFGNIKVLVTSRSERSIEIAVSPFSTSNVCIQLQDAEIEADIRIFVSNSISKESRMKKWPEGLKTDVESALVLGAKGMFRWVKCQLDVLRKCTTVRDVRKALNKLPPTLDETYERILLGIDPEERDKAYAALQWLIFSARPLRLEELAEAVVIEPGANSFSPEDRMFDPHDIASICRSLVSLSADASEIRLAHYSVQEYLLSDRIGHGPSAFFSIIRRSATVLIAEVCLTYLLLFDKPHSLSDNSLSEWPLLDYACRYWFHHVRTLEEPEGPSRCNTARLAEILLAPHHSFSFVNWLCVFEPDRYWIAFNPRKDPSSFATPLYYASYCGVLNLVRTLLEKGADLEARGGLFTTPLNAAVYTNCTAVASLLIQNKADVNVIDESITRNLALTRASGNGNEELTRLLLQSGAEVGAVDVCGGTSLHITSFWGQISTTKILVEYHAEIDARAKFTKADLEPGSNIAARWNIGRTPLMEAAWGGQEEMAKLLLDLGADINAVDDHGMTALIRAARCGHENLVKMLLSRGADPTVKDKKGWTANKWLLTTSCTTRSSNLDERGFRLLEEGEKSPLGY